jgi:alpha-1,6-mannosyltransferase
MKTLHLTNSWQPRSGGIATFYRAVLRAAEMRGHQMRLIVPSDTTRVEETGRHCRIYHLRAPRAPFNSAYRTLYPHRYLLPGGDILRILNQEQPDLVETCDKYTLFYLGGLLRVGAHPMVRFRPTIVGLSCERMDDNMAAYVSPRAPAMALTRLYMRWLYLPLSDHHIAVSEHTAHELRSVSDGHKVTRGVWVLPMGVDTDTFSPERRTTEKRTELLRRIGCAPDTTLLLYAGRLVPEKNLGLLTEAMERLPDARLRMVFAGDGILRGELERRLDGRATFLGHLESREELADLYANCDVFVHPNPREPFGIAPLEAMASGLPMVAPDSGGVTTYAHAGNAWLTEPVPEAFAAAIKEAEQDDDLRRTRIAAALRTAAEYRWDAAANRYLDLYDDIHAYVKGSRPPRTAPHFITTPKTQDMTFVL